MTHSYTPKFKLFALRKRLAFHLSLIAGAGLLLVAFLVTLELGVGMLGVHGVWSILGRQWTLLALFAAVGLLVATGFTAMRTLSVLFVPLPMPEGVRISLEDAHDLHKLIESMTWVLESGRIDHIWITSEMNASVMQRPRNGFFGQVETHLMIGLPLMHSVTCSQLIAVLAHELAHLAVQRKGAGKHGALLRAWLLRALDKIGDTFPALGALADKWLNRFYCDMARLTRVEEFEADSLATGIVDAYLLGETLVEVSLREQFLAKDYWPRVLAQSMVRAKPLIRPYRDLSLGMTAGFLRTEMDNVFSTTKVQKSMHPSTRERLCALRVSPKALSTNDQPSSATYYLSPLLLTLAWVFDRAWWREMRPSWQLTYQTARRAHKDGAKVSRTR